MFLNSGDNCYLNSVVKTEKKSRIGRILLSDAKRKTIREEIKEGLAGEHCPRCWSSRRPYSTYGENLYVNFLLPYRYLNVWRFPRISYISQDGRDLNSNKLTKKMWFQLFITC